MNAAPRLTMLALLLAASAAVPPAAAQSAQSVLRTAFETYEQRVASIESYTVVQETMGVQVENYFEKRLVDGRSVFRMPGDADEGMGDFYSKLDGYGQHARLQGRETLQGEECYVLAFDDLSQIRLNEGFEPQQGNFHPRTGTFLIDTDDLVVRRITIEGEWEHEGTRHPSTMIVHMQDYRTVDGMPYPFQTVVTVEGLPPSGMSEEDLQKARESMEELQKQMEQMSDQQRAMMEQMMKPQLEQMERMLQASQMEFSVLVKELRVNTGPPQ
jgi:hypothetical protein